MDGQRNPLIDKQNLLVALHEALAAHFFREARRLGLSFDSAQVAALCTSLLDEPSQDLKQSKQLPLRVLKESSLFDTYRSENLEVQDYLHLVSQEMRKRLGQYVTPSVVVKYILDAAGYQFDKEILDKRLIDPACGSGIFLVEAIRVYLAALRRANQPIENWHQRVRSAFVGIDVDPIACLYARFNLSLLLTPSLLFWIDAHPEHPLPALPIYCLDTLKTLAGEMQSPRLFKERTPLIHLSEAFDFAVGNPPYHKISRLERDLKMAFQSSLYGHPNAYGLFLHAGLVMLRQGGTLAFIIPRSMLSGLYFQNLRGFIEQRAIIKEVNLIVDRKKVFENVLQGTMILVMKRQTASAEAKSLPDQEIKTSITRSLEDLERRQAGAVHVKRRQVVRPLNGTSIWFVTDSQQSYDILDKIINSHPLLSGTAVGCLAKTGPIVWNRVKPLLSSKPDPGTLPLVWATDVSRYCFTFGSSEKSRPIRLKLTQKTQGLVSKGLSLLVQRVTADEQVHRLVACLPEGFCAENPEGYFVENHLNIIQPSSRAPQINLYYLLGLICSDVIEFFFRTMNGNTQVSATELNLIPIPRGKFEEQIASLACQLQRTSDINISSSTENELNKKVAEAYGLTPSELHNIQSSLYKNRFDKGKRG